jgi:hypothetical protein
VLISGMAAHLTKAHTKGSKPDKIIRDALILELNRLTKLTTGEKVKKVQCIVRKLVENGMDGKTDAIKEIFDRVEGRPAQSVSVGQDPDLGPVGLAVAACPPLTREEWIKLYAGGG